MISLPYDGILSCCVTFVGFSCCCSWPLCKDREPSVCTIIVPEISSGKVEDEGAAGGGWELQIPRVFRKQKSCFLGTPLAFSF